jgi:hypothetical protein
MIYLELILDLGKLFGEDLGFAHAGVYFLFQNLGPPLENLNILWLSFIANSMSFVVLHDALGANVDMVVLAKVLSLLVGVLWTKLFLWMLFVLLFLLLGCDVLL